MEITLHNYEAFLLDYFEGRLSPSEVAALKDFAQRHPELAIELEDMELPYLSQEDIVSNLGAELKKTELNHPDEKLLNYLEGNLDESDKINFEAELAADKDLASELKQYEKTFLAPDPNLVFTNKSQLKKSEDQLLLNNQSIAYYENQLNLVDRVAFEKELSTNDKLKKELETVAKTKLMVDATVVYPFKTELKKQNKIITLYRFRTHSSMAAAILLLFGLLVLFNYLLPKPKPNTEVAAKAAHQPRIHEKEQAEPVKKEKTAPRLVKPVPQMTEKIEKLNRTKIYTDHQLAKQGQYDQNVAASNSPVTQPERVSAREETAQVVFPETKVKNEILQEKPELENTVTVQETTVAANENKPAGQLVQMANKQNNFSTIPEEYNDEESLETPVKKGFWRKVADLAKQANKLGVKTLDVEESSPNAFVLSFNHFSVEKK